MSYHCNNSISYQLDLLRFTLFLAVESRDAPSPKQNCFELTLGLTRDLGYFKKHATKIIFPKQSDPK